MLIYLKVKPNQRFNRVEKYKEDLSSGRVEWQIRLKAPAVDGKANENLVEYLSEVLELPRSKIIFKKGQTSRVKCIEIIGDEQVIRKRLQQQLKQGPE